MIEILAIDLSRRCSKQCHFCYNGSDSTGDTLWTPQEVIAFARDCIAHGTRAVSLGGGEPLEYPGIYDVIEALRPHCYLTMTTNGLLLDRPETMTRLASSAPDKVHISIHYPERASEVERVVRQIRMLQTTSIKPGVNLLVTTETLEPARTAYSTLREILAPDQIILIPLRYGRTPSPRALSFVAGGKPFQSPSCILGCRAPEGFCSVSWDKRVARCSYSPAKTPLPSLDYAGVCAALDATRFASCSPGERERRAREK